MEGLWDEQWPAIAEYWRERCPRLGARRRRHLPGAAPRDLDLQRRLVRAAGRGGRRQRQGQPRPEPLLVAGHRPGGHGARARRPRSASCTARTRSSTPSGWRCTACSTSAGRATTCRGTSPPSAAGGRRPSGARCSRRSRRPATHGPVSIEHEDPRPVARGGHRGLAGRAARGARERVRGLRWRSATTRVAKRFGATEALAPLDLTVPDGRFLAMLGPSGCGKTTALRLLAGLEQPTDGRIFIGERDVTRLEPAPPRRRDGLPELRAVPAQVGGGEHRLPAAAAPHRQARARRARRAASPSCSTSPTCWTARRASSPAASASASRSPGRSSATRRPS